MSEKRITLVGVIHRRIRKCPRCGGSGFVQRRGPIRTGWKMNVRCRSCGGTGERKSDAGKAVAP